MFRLQATTEKPFLFYYEFTENTILTNKTTQNTFAVIRLGILLNYLHAIVLWAECLVVGCIINALTVFKGFERCMS